MARNVLQLNTAEHPDAKAHVSTVCPLALQEDPEWPANAIEMKDSHAARAPWCPECLNGDAPFSLKSQHIATQQDTE